MITQSTDYSGRQVDIEHLQTITQIANITAVTKSLAKTQPKMVTGTQKLLQRYVALLLTQLGDVYLAPDQGTQFLNQILRGGGRSRGYIAQTFAFANSDVADQLRQEDNLEAVFGPTQPDERLRQATLLDFSVDYVTATLSLTIHVETEAGTSFVYVVPVPVPRT